MVTVDLITGFLGAGKTTFIHGYLHYLKEQGYKVQIIENEFGDVSIDSELLREEDCEIHDLAGLCMCCVGKDAFIRMLKESSQRECDRIIVEPSGIYDVDEFFEVLSLPDIADKCQIGSIITIADPMGLAYMTEESEYLTFAQLLASGLVVLSKTQLITSDELDKARETIDRIMKANGCEAGLLAELIIKPWETFSKEDYELVMDSGYMRIVHDREIFDHQEAFSSEEFLLKVKDAKELSDKIRAVFESPACGIVFRIKGYARTESGQCYEINCTSETFSIKEGEKELGTIVVIGQRIRRKEIKEIFAG